MVVDSHCHLNYAGLVEDQDAVIARARAAGVDAMLNISTRVAEWDAVVGTAHRHAGIWASIGIHPHEADGHAEIDTARLIAASADAKVIAIGETGLDYYYDKSDRERQRTSFRSHIAAARATGLPIIVHTRDAEADTLAIMTEEMGRGAYTGVIHCFTASQDFAERALALGLYISLSGIVTFKNARDLQASAITVPADRLLIETDAPFLAPVPNRGKTCEPAFVTDTARFLADLRQEPLEELAQNTSNNFYRLFTKATPQSAAPSAQSPPSTYNDGAAPRSAVSSAQSPPSTCDDGVAPKGSGPFAQSPPSTCDGGVAPKGSGGLSPQNRISHQQTAHQQNPTPAALPQTPSPC